MTVSAHKRVCVFCGSRTGSRALYREVAAKMGRSLAERGAGLVYGGGRVGLMGALADAALAAGGEVIGVIPRSLASSEVAHTSLSKLHLVETMHERKALMASYADAFVALPGGFGTLDEFFEALTWQQLGFHDKPCGLVNVDGYFDRLLGMLDHAVDEGLLRREDRARLAQERAVDPLLDRLIGPGLPLPGVR